MAYILKDVTTYDDGLTVTSYYKSNNGLFVEDSLDRDKAKQFKTKKEATKAMRETGRKYTIEEVSA